MSRPPSAAPSPLQSFRFRLEEMSVVNQIPIGLQMELFKDVKWLADGSHANLFTANMVVAPDSELAVGSSNSSSNSSSSSSRSSPQPQPQTVKVVVKMLKKESLDNPLARREFDVEFNILSRVRHSSVVRILGAGKSPRPFLVLEHLSKGTLSMQLAQNQSVSEFFRRPTFTKKALYSHARDLALCLYHLQEGCHAEACVIHRGEWSGLGLGKGLGLKIVWCFVLIASSIALHRSPHHTPPHHSTPHHTTPHTQLRPETRQHRLCCRRHHQASRLWFGHCGPPALSAGRDVRDDGLHRLAAVHVARGRRAPALL